MWHTWSMANTDPLQDVRQAQAAYQTAAKAADEARSAYHAAIATAAGNGVRQRDLVQLTGYTRERIRQLSRHPSSEPAKD